LPVPIPAVFFSTAMKSRTSPCISGPVAASVTFLRNPRFSSIDQRRKFARRVGNFAIDPEQQRDRLEELLVQMGLETVRQNKAYTLSGGERRRLEIARSLTLQPSFILLDEPFSGIDPLTVKDLQEIIRDLSRSGIGVLITDHNVRETLSVTDRAYILRSGKIFRKGRPPS